MPKKITLYVKESAKILVVRLSKSKGKLRSDKIKTLLYIKEERFHYQSDIGKDLGRTEKTIRGWIQEYSINGYTGLLKEKRGGNNTRTISDKVVKGIPKFLKEINMVIEISSDKYWTVVSYDLNSFKALKLRLEVNFSEKIEYHALYSHLRRNHKVKFNFIKVFFRKYKREIRTR